MREAQQAASVLSKTNDIKGRIHGHAVAGISALFLLCLAKTIRVDLHLRLLSQKLKFWESLLYLLNIEQGNVI
jgi:hypothetical protein